MITYQVVVGNIGAVLDTTDKYLAIQTFRQYVAESKALLGREGGQSIYLFTDDRLIDEYTGAVEYAEKNE